jgi:hypothetical protein
VLPQVNEAFNNEAMDFTVRSSKEPLIFYLEY